MRQSNLASDNELSPTGCLLSALAFPFVALWVLFIIMPYKWLVKHTIGRKYTDTEFAILTGTATSEQRVTEYIKWFDEAIDENDFESAKRFHEYLSEHTDKLVSVAKQRGWKQYGDAPATRQWIELVIELTIDKNISAAAEGDIKAMVSTIELVKQYDAFHKYLYGISWTEKWSRPII